MIDVMGEMWGTMIINCAAIVCSTAGLLALCSKDVVVLAMVGRLYVCTLAKSACVAMNIPRHQDEDVSVCAETLE